jgi:tRNA A-37 threonylcarbamoyl transferase component Bud32
LPHAPAHWNKAITACFGAEVQLDEKIFFVSKKNQVSLLCLRDESGAEFKVVAKMFCWGELKKEAKILKAALNFGIKVPKVIAKYKNILFMEYICGQDLGAGLKGNSKLDCILMNRLGRWLAGFHQAFKKGENLTLLKGDIRLHNFILKGREIYGVDFEESTWGKPLEDLAEMFATIEGCFAQDKAGRKVMQHCFLNGYQEIAPISLQELADLTRACLAKRARYKIK